MLYNQKFPNQSGSPNYSGGTTINAGTLFLSAASAPATGTYSPLGSGLVTIGTGGTLKTNPGNGGGNTFTFANALRLNGGTLYHQDGNSVFNGLTTVDAASSIKTEYGAKNITLAGGLAGGANLTVSDQGGAYESGTVILGADGAYSGNLTINADAGANGAVQLNSANALQNATVTVNTTAVRDGGNAYNVRGLILGAAANTNFSIAGLSGTQAAAAIHNTNDANTRTLTVNQSATTQFAGSIGGTTANTQRLNLVKSGSGSLTLAETNTYTGTTSINQGTLALGASGSIANSSNIIVGANTTLDVSAVGGWTLGATQAQTLSGTGAVTGAMTVGADGVLSPGNSPGDMTFHDNLNLNGTLNLEITGLAPGLYHGGFLHGSSAG